MKNKIKARALILLKNKVFLVKDREYWNYILPWGTQKNGEWVKETLEREIIEECWIYPIIEKFIWFREYKSKNWYVAIQFLFLIKNSQDFLCIEEDKCSHSFEWEEAWFFSLEKLQKENANYPSDLEEIIKKSKSWEIYYSFMWEY